MSNKKKLKKMRKRLKYLELDNYDYLSMLSDLTDMHIMLRKRVDALEKELESIRNDEYSSVSFLTRISREGEDD